MSKKTWSVHRQIVCVIAALAFFPGCESTPSAVKPDVAFQDMKAPDWVKRGKKPGNEFCYYGLGSAMNISNTSLLRTTAENRARNAVAAKLQVLSESLGRDYQASTSAGEGPESFEQNVSTVVKTVVSQTMLGVEIDDYWQNPATGEFFALAKLDLNAFKNAAAKSPGLDAKVRGFIQDNAETEFQKLDKETERQH